jgi:hypothetical protein
MGFDISSTMRTGAAVIVTIGLLSGGCASQHKPTEQADATTQPAGLVEYEPSSAGSLVFDPPVTVGQPPLELSRDDRTPAAFVGYESQTATYFYLRIDDRSTSDFSDRYERRAVSEKVGVTYR